MSRHRNVRNYAYEEDMYDDVYGHSVEEHDLCVSPTTAQQFLYRRNETQHPNLSSFMEEPLGYKEEEYEDGKGYLAVEKDYKTPKLDRESEAKLLSCLDEFRSILGDHCDENEATAAILRHDFDLERAIDYVLNQGGNQDLRSHNVPKQKKDVISDFCSETNKTRQYSSFDKPLEQCNKPALANVQSGKQDGCSPTLPSEKLSISPLQKLLNNGGQQNKPLSSVSTRTSPLTKLLESRNQSALSPLIKSATTESPQSPKSGTKQLKSLRLLVGETSSNKSDDMKVASLMGTLHLQDSSKSPLSLLLGGRQRSEHEKQLSTKPLASDGHLSSFVHIPMETSPLSKLFMHSKQSLVSKECSNVSLEKSSIVHIPRNDGALSLRQLLKTRQSPKENRMEEDLDNNSNIAQPNSSSERTVFTNSFTESRHDGLSSAPLKTAKTEKKSKPKYTDSVLARVSTRIVSNDTKNMHDVKDGVQRHPVGPDSTKKVEDCVQIEAIEFHKDLASHDSVLHVPSVFAYTLLVYYKKPGRHWKPRVKRMFENDLGIIPFDFNEPSPDDIVLSKQKKHTSKK